MALSRKIALRMGIAILAIILIPACGQQTPASGKPSPVRRPDVGDPGAAAGQILLAWSPAVSLGDGAIAYNVFVTNLGSGLEDPSAPSFQTSSGTGMVVSGLISTNLSWLIVRAQDSTGAEEGNTVEQTAIAP